MFPIAATIVAVVFAVITWRAARPQEVALRIWSVAIAQFGIATAALAWGIAFGWTPLVYRIFYLTGAVLNVAWLALGTVWLLAPRALAMVLNVLFVVAFTIASAFVMSTELRSETALRGALPAPGDVMADIPRTLSRVYSIVGSTVVLVGLLWAIARRRHVLGLGLLALGVLIAGVASAMVRAGRVEAFSAGLAIGIAVMCAGFMRTRRRPASASAGG
ncbi:MAG: hypothetical protein WD826_04560 [Actinomycetota bacterium]